MICFSTQVPKPQPVALITSPEDTKHYDEARQCVEELALYLKPLSSARGKEKNPQLLFILSLLLDMEGCGQIYSRITSCTS